MKYEEWGRVTFYKHLIDFFQSTHISYFHFINSCQIFLKLFLLRNISLGHIGKIKDKSQAQKQIGEIQLLTKSKLQTLFPEAQIFEEKFLWFTKSFVAYHIQKT